MNATDRFWSKVDRPDSGCWSWLARRDRKGYGQFFPSPRKSVKAHRYAYELLVGPIPEGLSLNHLCRVHECVNPAHLEPVTNAENIRRGMAPSTVIARTGLCKRGHDMAAAYVNPTNGERACRVCTQDRYRERYATDPAFRQRKLDKAARDQVRRTERDREARRLLGIGDVAARAAHDAGDVA